MLASSDVATSNSPCPLEEFMHAHSMSKVQNTTIISNGNSITYTDIINNKQVLLHDIINVLNGLHTKRRSTLLVTSDIH